ncbi:putative DnaJ domain-containing protein [Lupinus albus]|uniref:Putative DnaJ domain-containing protein n=1 Tax=Lupinus albus TaxID=3870 RepID=A0A6A4NZ49_LUPAL|nr:putative DnaJ domain-containing protein [Lupinus albus]
MECNKDEAIRAKEIAERKFIAKDTLGAKKFALKAQNLFPALEGIPQMLATLDVHISSENKINGETDWYGILGANPLADEDTVRKHYRKLALMLHPDKNKSVGADGAFKLISEAWSLLSDKAKRAAYDEKRNAKAGKVSTKFGGSSEQTGVNGIYNFTKTTTSSARAQKSTAKDSQKSASKDSQKNTAKEHTPSSTHKSKTNTFWTVCHRCKMQYEYLTIYLNLKLLCPNCNEPFYAVETAPPPASVIRPPSTSWTFSQHQQSSGRQVPNRSKSNAGKNKMPPPNVGAGGYYKNDSNNHTNFQWTPFSKTSGVSNVSQAANVVQQAYDKVKRERVEAQAAMKREEALKRKQHAFKKGYFSAAKRRRGGMEDASMSNHATEHVNKIGVGNSGAGLYSVCRVEKDSVGLPRDLLMTKARKEINKKLRDIQSNNVDKTVVKESEDGIQKINGEGEKSVRNSETCAQTNIKKSENKKSGSEYVKSFVVNTTSKIGTIFMETLPVDIPDPEFHDFNKDRTEICFGENQVWSVYNDNDGMPRYYAMIHNVISLNPFRMQIRWLNSKTNSELAPLNWVVSGFLKTCGDFRTGKLEICDSVNIFSHRMGWRKGNNGAVCIYPKKGDVWALYRNWSIYWDELTADEDIHKYDMVEVLEDFTEEQGVIVIPLVKVAGFKTVFHHHLDPREIRIIRREEMFRFSHRVPSYSLTGQEAANAPKGCRVLDPAATPSELLQVIETVKEEEMMDSEDAGVKETSDNIKETENTEIIIEMENVGEENEGNNKDVKTCSVEGVVAL